MTADADDRRDRLARPPEALVEAVALYCNAQPNTRQRADGLNAILQAALDWADSLDKAAGVTFAANPTLSDSPALDVERLARALMRCDELGGSRWYQQTPYPETAAAIAREYARLTDDAARSPQEPTPRGGERP